MNTSEAVPTERLEKVVSTLLNSPSSQGGIPLILNYHWWAIQFKGEGGAGIESSFEAAITSMKLHQILDANKCPYLLTQAHKCPYL